MLVSIFNLFEFLLGVVCDLLLRFLLFVFASFSSVDFESVNFGNVTGL